MNEYIYEHKPSGADHMGKPVELPTLVQREEIVRCRDCVYYEQADEPSEVYPDRYWCDKLTVYMPTDGFCSFGKRKEGRMSMCYLCDMCKLSGYTNDPLAVYPTWECWGDFEPKPLVAFAIDYGKQDPHEICEHFKPKEGGDGLDAS